MHRVRQLTICFGFFLVASWVHAVPPEVTNLVFQTSSRFVWDAQADLGGANVYRGIVTAGGGADVSVCLLGSVQGTAATDPEVPAAGAIFFYEVAAFDETGQGPVGFSSSGMPHTPAVACVPSRRNFNIIADLSGDGLPDIQPFINPAVEEWSSSREAVGVVLSNGEVVLDTLQEMSFVDDPDPRDAPTAGALVVPTVVPARTQMVVDAKVTQGLCGSWDCCEITSPRDSASGMPTGRRMHGYPGQIRPGAGGGGGFTPKRQHGRYTFEKGWP